MGLCRGYLSGPFSCLKQKSLLQPYSTTVHICHPLSSWFNNFFKSDTGTFFMQDFREKNTDHMRPDIVALLRSSKNAFISGMIGIDPVAVFRWAVLRAFFRAVIAFREAGKRHIQRKTGKQQTSVFYHASVCFLTLP